MEDRKWLKGWKAIEKATGFSRGSILKMVEEHDLPLKYVCNRPVLTQNSLDEWILGMPNYTDVKKG